MKRIISNISRKTGLLSFEWVMIIYAVLTMLFILFAWRLLDNPYELLLKRIIPVLITFPKSSTFIISISYNPVFGLTIILSKLSSSSSLVTCSETFCGYSKFAILESLSTAVLPSSYLYSDISAIFTMFLSSSISSFTLHTIPISWKSNAVPLVCFVITFGTYYFLSFLK